MNQLSREKRQQLILVALATLLVLAGLWYGVINWQRARLKELSQSIAKAQQRLANVQKAVTSADKIDANLKEAAQKLNDIESSMATGDLFTWFVLMLREFQSGYKVDIQPPSAPTTGNVNLFAEFPYSQATYTVRGIAFYNDLGKFVANFENHFPYMRVQNFEILPIIAINAGENERVSFKMDIVTLVKPTGP